MSIYSRVLIFHILGIFAFILLIRNKKKRAYHHKLSIRDCKNVIFCLYRTYLFGKIVINITFRFN